MTVKRVASALVLVAALGTGAAAGGAGRHEDSPCRAPRVSWTNDPCAGRQWGLVRIRAPEAWLSSRGAGAVVSVVDTGADFSHPDLRRKLVRVRGSNLLRNTAYRCPYERRSSGRRSPAVAQDDNGHGTHVAGIVAARTGNGLGVAGVAPAARVLPVKVLDDEGGGNDAAVARGICFAVAHGAHVVNLSLGVDPVAQILVEGTGRLTARAITHAYRKGVAVVVAAGNEGFPVCGFRSVRAEALCIGAVDGNDIKARYSNFGGSLDLVAPGGAGGVLCADDADVWSTIRPQAEDDCSRRGYQPLAGTSMAAPHVAGTAALLRARFGRRASPAFVYGRLRSTADDLGVPGADPLYGYGRVNARRAVR